MDNKGILGNSGDENDLYLNCGGGCKTLHLKKVNFTLCKLSLNKPGFKKKNLKKYISFDSVILLQETQSARIF